MGEALRDGAALVPAAEADGNVGEKLRSLSRSGVSEVTSKHVEPVCRTMNAPSKTKMTTAMFE